MKLVKQLTLYRIQYRQVQIYRSIVVVIKENKVEITTKVDVEENKIEEPVVESEVPTEPVVVDETEEEATEE